MDPGRAGVAGPGPGADDPLAVQRGAQPLVADVVLHDLGDRGLEDDVDGLGVAGEELLDLGPVGRVAHPGVAPAVAQRAADPVEQGLVGLVARHVPGASSATAAALRAGSSHSAIDVPSSNGHHMWGSTSCTR